MTTQADDDSETQSVDAAVAVEYATPICFGEEVTDNKSSPPRDCSSNSMQRRRSSSHSTGRKAMTTRRSSMGSAGALDDSDSHSEFHLHDVDVSKNYGHGTVPIAGRESHTSDLREFDRYVDALRGVDRQREEMLWKLGVAGINLHDEEEECENDQDGQDDAMPPQSVGVARGSHVNADDLLDQMFGNSHDDEQQPNLRYPYNHKFWTFFRSILEKAEPVGFCELSDPNQTSVKGPQDATAFISKVMAIKSINPIQPALLAQEGGFEEDDVLAELLYATSVGLVAMRFAPECVQCGSAVMETDMLGRVPSRANCEGPRVYYHH